MASIPEPRKGLTKPSRRHPADDEESAGPPPPSASLAAPAAPEAQAAAPAADEPPPAVPRRSRSGSRSQGSQALAAVVDEPQVPLAVRVPRSLRQRVRLAALTDDVSMQDWVTGVLTRELDGR